MASGDRQNTGRETSGLSESPLSPLTKNQGKTGKAGSSKKMTQKEQSERFKLTAREIETGESGTAFERAIQRVLTEKRGAGAGPSRRKKDVP